MVDGRHQRGARTRAAVLERAVATASTEGLGGLSLAHLASSLEVSKSGLFAHWPDKQALQLAIIARAEQQWVEHIVEPALREPTALQRLWALHEGRLRFYASGVLPGGCFFAAVEPEYDDHPGPVRDAVAEAIGKWTRLLQRLAERAVARGELRAGTEPAQLVFEIQALGKAAVTHVHLVGSDEVYALARRGVLERLRALANDTSLLPEA